jgi:single-strand DNA-binding protein
MNQVALVGNITDDPELRYAQSGAALAGFTVAVSHRSKHNGEWQDVNDGFFRCTAWRSVAENAAHTLKKGMRIFVAGKLIQRT